MRIGNILQKYLNETRIIEMKRVKWNEISNEILLDKHNPLSQCKFIWRSKR